MESEKSRSQFEVIALEPTGYHGSNLNSMEVAMYITFIIYVYAFVYIHL